jgi:hypothetical protein|mmetsp:Transcript_63945/g.106816  ORF Transcript_63945/g.106816 Transcript_63945/m.106816 type:complete len:188 (-) Transcript_63945:926-1489(-)
MQKAVLQPPRDLDTPRPRNLLPQPNPHPTLYQCLSHTAALDWEGRALGAGVDRRARASRPQQSRRLEGMTGTHRSISLLQPQLPHQLIARQRIAATHTKRKVFVAQRTVICQVVHLAAAAPPHLPSYVQCNDSLINDICSCVCETMSVQSFWTSGALLGPVVSFLFPFPWGPLEMKGGGRRSTDGSR